ncbi:hypothetical protein F5B21DRAFT_526312 [Xylaria acuta]|nr:hypothetical protein F5B21DRAFT_526312 [Xylaria acuta]
MDGLSSAPPSTSVAPNPNHGFRTSFSPTPRPRVRELFSNANAAATVVIDPPRPAKEGCEWVWFPAGYWAEREVVEIPPKESIRLFKWRSRSGKSGSESPNNSPRTPLTAHSFLESRMEKSTDYLTERRPQTRTATSSESGGYCFPLNHMPDAPLPSPYLTEESHVQSLQWPSIDASTRNGSISGSSVIKSRTTVSPSPLHFSSADDDVESDTIVAFTPDSQGIANNSADITNTGLLSSKAGGGKEVKPKKSFISWRMFSEHRRKLRRSQASSDEYPGDNMAHIQPPRPQSPARSPLRKESTVSDKSRKSRKSRSAKLFTKARWNRKFSSSSGASTASSVHNSIRSQSSVVTPGSERGETSAISNAWASEYPGGEAMRVQTPRIIQNSLDHFPRSFFSDLTPPSTPPRRPLSRQEGQSNLKKTTLSTSFTPGGDSSASPTTPRVRVRATRNGGGGEEGGGGGDYYHESNDNDDDNDNDNDNGADDKPTPGSGYGSGTRRGGGAGRPRPKPKEKEWWEVSVPVSYGQVDQRAAFRFDLPEHLPSSPMCPTNKRHKSGGTGVCVYHGRARGVRKTASPHVSEGSSAQGKGGGDEEEEFEDADEAGSDVWK